MGPKRRLSKEVHRCQKSGRIQWKRVCCPDDLGRFSKRRYKINHAVFLLAAFIEKT
ncbi:hypothetical protein CU011_1327 [Enterococcus faecium]|nr:hypothetical protein [Enterococcus faecium]MBK4840142.1 hypothetical protein [Enterococcus faecium]MBK4861495.1 hypothetical protein [Enterococcus faecium]